MNPSDNLRLAERTGPKTIIALFAYGGVHPATNINLINDTCKAAFVAGHAAALVEAGKIYGLVAEVPTWEVKVVAPPQDALVSRARASTVHRFLKTDSEVLIMLDHDLSWNGPSINYEGDLLHLARKCAQTKGIVGGCVSKKTKGQGIASMWAPGTEGRHDLGTDELVEALFVGAAFTAFHRDALEKVIAYTRASELGGAEECVPGFVPIFAEFNVRHPLDATKMLHLSEDWALCERWRRIGGKCWLSMRPLVTHYGEKAFTVYDDSGIATPPETVEPVPVKVGQTRATTFEAPAKISLLHATRGRPAKATEAIKQWVERAALKDRLEYIVSIDDDDASMADWKPPEVGIPVTVVCGTSRGNVDAYNRAFDKSTGDICFQVHDDLTPPVAYDSLVANKLGDPAQPRVLHVSDGTNANPSKPHLITVAIGTREFFKRLGGMYHPEYVSIYCDDDLSTFAAKHGYAVEAPELVFQHDWQGPDRDETQKRSYRMVNWQSGADVLKRRTAAGFPVVQP